MNPGIDSQRSIFCNMEWDGMDLILTSGDRESPQPDYLKIVSLKICFSNEIKLINNTLGCFPVKINGSSLQFEE